MLRLASHVSAESLATLWMYDPYQTPYGVIITVTKIVLKSQLNQLRQIIMDNSLMIVKQISIEKNMSITFDTVTFKTYAFELSFETHMLVILPVNCHMVDKS